jgi:uncharacterized protein (TIGR02391 family)
VSFTSFETYRGSLESLNLRKGSVTDTFRNLILSHEILKKPMTSSEFVIVFYKIAGKRLRSSDIAKYLLPIQKKGIIRRELVDGKILWYGSWQTGPEKAEDSLYDQLIRNKRIRKVSRALYLDGHYSSAIFEAYKAVNNMVKEKTKLESDGKDLMARAFNEQNPVLALNKLSTQSELDEQIGFRFIFMGAMIGVRNPKAHDTVVQRDPIRTLQYLALADLLATRVEESHSGD